MTKPILRRWYFVCEKPVYGASCCLAAVAMDIVTGSRVSEVEMWSGQNSKVLYRNSFKDLFSLLILFLLPKHDCKAVHAV
jgi:hypothetical protein